MTYNPALSAEQNLQQQEEERKRREEALRLQRDVLDKAKVQGATIIVATPSTMLAQNQSTMNRGNQPQQSAMTTSGIKPNINPHRITTMAGTPPLNPHELDNLPIKETLANLQIEEPSQGATQTKSEMNGMPSKDDNKTIYTYSIGGKEVSEAEYNAYDALDDRGKFDWQKANGLIDKDAKYMTYNINGVEIDEDEYNNYEKMTPEDQFNFAKSKNIIPDDAVYVPPIDEQTAAHLKQMVADGMIPPEQVEGDTVAHGWSYIPKASVEYAANRQAAFKKSVDALYSLQDYRDKDGNYNIDQAIADGKIDLVRAAGFDGNDILDAQLRLANRTVPTPASPKTTGGDYVSFSVIDPMVNKLAPYSQETRNPYVFKQGVAPEYDLTTFLADHPEEYTNLVQANLFDKDAVDVAWKSAKAITDIKTQIGNNLKSGTTLKDGTYIAITDAISNAGFYKAERNGQLDKFSNNWVKDGKMLTQQDIAQIQWDSLTPEQQIQVADLYNQDVWKGSYFAEYNKQLTELSQKAGLLGSLTYGMVLPITTPIAKAATKQSVSGMEWALGGVQLVLLVLPGISGGVGKVVSTIATKAGLSATEAAARAALATKVATAAILSTSGAIMTTNTLTHLSYLKDHPAQLAIELAVDGLVVAGAIGSVKGVFSKPNFYEGYVETWQKAIKIANKDGSSVAQDFATMAKANLEYAQQVRTRVRIQNMIDKLGLDNPESFLGKNLNEKTLDSLKSQLAKAIAKEEELAVKLNLAEVKFKNSTKGLNLGENGEVPEELLKPELASKTKQSIEEWTSQYKNKIQALEAEYTRAETTLRQIQAKYPKKPDMWIDAAANLQVARTKLQLAKAGDADTLYYQWVDTKAELASLKSELLTTEEKIYKTKSTNGGKVGEDYSQDKLNLDLYEKNAADLRTKVETTDKQLKALAEKIKETTFDENKFVQTEFRWDKQIHEKVLGLQDDLNAAKTEIDNLRKALDSGKFDKLEIERIRKQIAEREQEIANLESQIEELYKKNADVMFDGPASGGGTATATKTGKPVTGGGTGVGTGTTTQPSTNTMTGAQLAALLGIKSEDAIGTSIKHDTVIPLKAKPDEFTKPKSPELTPVYNPVVKTFGDTEPIIKGKPNVTSKPNTTIQPGVRTNAGVEAASQTETQPKTETQTKTKEDTTTKREELPQERIQAQPMPKTLLKQELQLKTDTNFKIKDKTIIPPPLPKKEKQNKKFKPTQKDLENATALKAGFGWWLKFKDGSQKFYRKIPKGVRNVQRGKGSGYRSVQTIKGIPVKTTMKIGFMNANIDRPSYSPGAQGAVSYRPNMSVKRDGVVLHIKNVGMTRKMPKGRLLK